MHACRGDTFNIVLFIKFKISIFSFLIWRRGRSEQCGLIKKQCCACQIMYVFYFYFNSFQSVLLEHSQKIVLKWFDLVGFHCTTGKREMFIYFSLKQNALKHYNWWQPRRKLYHRHRDSTGCRMLLSAGSENSVTSGQRGGAAGFSLPLAFWEKASPAHPKLPWHCT